MRRSVMRPDALLHRGAATRFRVAIGLAVAASAGVMLWGVGTQSVLASEFGRNAARENRGFTRYPVVAYLSGSESEFGRNVAERNSHDARGHRSCPDGRTRRGQGGDRQAAGEPERR